MKYTPGKSMQIKEVPLELKKKLFMGLERLLIEEWGGPKSLLAQIYIKDTIIPDLVNSLILNHTFLQNKIYAYILANKFQTQYGYPEAFAQGISNDILGFAIQLLAEYQITPLNTSLWEPWERLFRLLCLGEDLSTIAKKTGYSEDYIELVKKSYLRFTNSNKQNLAYIPEDSLFANELDQFMRKFSSRFVTRTDYMQLLLAEQFAIDGHLPLSAEGILDIFLAVHNWDGSLTKQDLFSYLKKNSLTYGYNKQKEFKRLKQNEFAQILDFLLEKRYLICYQNCEQKIFLTSNGAKIVAGLICPQIKEEILQIILSNDPNRFKKAAAKINLLNPEVIIILLELLVNTNNIQVIDLLYQLPLNKNKQLYLKAIWACGKLKNIKAIDLLTSALNHKDGLIRAKACEALGLLSDKSTYFLLIKCLKDPLNFVREQALMALEKLKLHSSLKYIEEIILIEEDYRVKSVARDVREKIMKTSHAKK